MISILLILTTATYSIFNVVELIKNRNRKIGHEISAVSHHHMKSIILIISRIIRTCHFWNFQIDFACYWFGCLLLWLIWILFFWVFFFEFIFDRFLFDINIYFLLFYKYWFYVLFSISISFRVKIFNIDKSDLNRKENLIR